MASERQIAANRANAQKSTGPKTVAGRLKSSRNAFRHGLSAQLRLDSEGLKRVDAIARLLVGSSVDGKQHIAANEMAQAQLELSRIRAVRANILAGLDLASGNLQMLRHLAALDRYERYAHTRRRRASQKL
jgi:hypothetical protein